MLVGGQAAAQPVLALKARSDEIARRFAQLLPYLHPRAVFLHLGAAECALAAHAAAYVERVYAVDPHEALARFEAPVRAARLPCNLRLVYSSGEAIAVEPASVDVAFSETLQPARLGALARALKKGGAYLFRPQKSDSAAGLRAQLARAGFPLVRFPPLFRVFPRNNLIAGFRQ